METLYLQEVIQNYLLLIASFIGSGINGNFHKTLVHRLDISQIASFIGSGINGNSNLS